MNNGFFDRRQTIAAGLGAVLGSCAKATEAKPMQYEMPLESEPHQRCFMQWPVSLAVYDRPMLARVQAAIAKLANTISRHEPVVMLADARNGKLARKLLGPAIEIWDIPTDDLWCRDSGPTFVRDADGGLAVAHIRFNGWGRKQPHGRDALVAERVAKRLGLPIVPSGLVGEQGGLEHDGAGTVMAHASSWANANRNRIALPEIEKRLLKAIGGRKMIWAPGIKGKDITDYHIDALARFVGPGKVLIQLGAEIDPDDPWSVSGHQTLRILEKARDADGKLLKLVRLADPVETRINAPDFVASYVNYYVANGAVIAAQFGDKAADGRAREVLQGLYPGRVVEMIEVDAIGESGGGIHCATQQQPKAQP
ncbi:MAG: agmatine deiminase family protein [Novosphingobium sp.]|uniref:agmatine deiminase family protein n=1 Tax=Novosphingobium sp. TaxID=1874826 RepID=UPI0032BBAB78